MFPCCCDDCFSSLMRFSPSSLILRASENCIYQVVPVNQVQYQCHDTSSCTMYRLRPPIIHFHRTGIIASTNFRYQFSNDDEDRSVNWNARLCRSNLQLLQYTIESLNPDFSPGSTSIRPISLRITESAV